MGVEGEAGSTGSFRLLFVCTGNICRSPFAEILTRHLLIGRLGGRAASAFELSSAGVQAVVGAPMHELTRRELAPWRLDGPASDHFAARQFRSAMVGVADLVLGVNTRHRSAVIEREPLALSNTFGLREFARLAGEVRPETLPATPVTRAHALVDVVRQRRGLSPPTLPAVDQVPDPMGGPQEAHYRAASLIEEAVSAIVDVIAPRWPAADPAASARSAPGWPGRA